MASIIDGSTYAGYWKITPDDSTPDIWYQIPKDKIIFKPSDAGEGVIRFVFGTEQVVTGTDANTVDEFGNALDTSAKVAEYITANRQY